MSNNGDALLLNKPYERMTTNELEHAVSLMRAKWLQNVIDPRRDLEGECGYPRDVTPVHYRNMYDREGIAARVVGIYPDECWAVEPEIYEVEDPQETPFEEDWNNLLLSEKNNPLHYMHRIDVLSGIGRYGALLVGIDDGLPLDTPATDIDQFGQMVPNTTPHNLLYLRPFDESMAAITQFERNINSPRFGEPIMYHCIFADARVGEQGNTAAVVSVSTHNVHWTRMVHIAEQRETSEVFAVPRMQSTFNRLCDVRKILGGSAEMFWKGGFPGMAFELDPHLVTAGIQLDNASLKSQLDAYQNGLQRYLALIGLKANSLAPQVANPVGNLTVQLEAIAMSIGAPLRIFMGSEQAQLASGQDVRTWNRRLARRQERYCSPLLIRPIINRMVNLGVIRPPTEKYWKVRWPDVNMPTADDKSKIADRQIAALYKYITGGGYQVMAPLQFFTMILGLSHDQAMVVIDGLTKGPKIEIIPPMIMAAEARAGTEVQSPEGALD